MPQSRGQTRRQPEIFEAQLAATDKQVGNELAPLRERVFRFHDAYGYYSSTTGLTRSVAQ